MGRPASFRFPILALLLALLVPLAARAEEITVSQTMHGFMHDMPRTIRADHPAILPVAAAIRAVTTNPLEQLVMVNDVTHLLVDYDDDLRVYGRPEFYATLDQMIAKRRQEGWIYLRDDCDGRAVFAAHLLASLGIKWRLEASYWKRHAWVVANVGGVDYDLLDYRPDSAASSRLSYRLIGHWFVHPSHQPPGFNWRRRWAEGTDHDLAIGLRLGMLTVDSTVVHWEERHSTDWTEAAPQDERSPLDPRTLTMSVAGFPYGEKLTEGNLLAVQNRVPVPAPAADAALLTPALATNSSASPDAASPAR